MPIISENNIESVFMKMRKMKLMNRKVDSLFESFLRGVRARKGLKLAVCMSSPTGDPETCYRNFYHPRNIARAFVTQRPVLEIM